MLFMSLRASIVCQYYPELASFLHSLVVFCLFGGQRFLEKLVNVGPLDLLTDSSSGGCDLRLGGLENGFACLPATLARVWLC